MGDQHWNSQKTCGVSVPGNIQYLTGDGPDEPALAHAALSRELGVDNFQRYFPTSAILCIIAVQYSYPLV